MLHMNIEHTVFQFMWHLYSKLLWACTQKIRKAKLYLYAAFLTMLCTRSVGELLAPSKHNNWLPVMAKYFEEHANKKVYNL